MELKLNIGYQELIELIKQLPANQIRKLKADLASIVTDNDMEKDRSDFQEFLLEGPVMEDDQYQDFLFNRKYFNTWRSIVYCRTAVVLNSKPDKVFIVSACFRF